MAKIFKRTQQAIASVKHPLIAAAYTKKPKLVFALHSCSHCSTQVVVNKFAKPACPVCANTMTPVGDASTDMTLTPNEINELPKVGHCESCDTEYHAMPDAAPTLANHKMHCTVCASVVDMEMPEEISEDTSEEMEDVSEDESDMEPVESEMEDDSEEYDDSTDSEGDEFPEEEMDVEAEMTEDAETEDSSEEDSDPMADGSDFVSDEETKTAPEGDATVTASTKKRKKIKYNPLAAVLAKLDDAQIDVIMISAGESAESVKWYMFANDRPVAIARYNNASDNVKTIFGSNKFLAAFKATAEEGLTEQAVTDFGFEPINVEVPVDDAAAQNIEQQVTAATKKFAATAGDTKKLFERCIGIASVGINKGVFSDIDNTFRAALIARLNSLRVRDAESVVDSVLAEHGESLLRSIVVKATELTDKSPEALDEIADMVSQASYRAPSRSSGGNSSRSRIPFMASAEPTEGVTDDSSDDESDISNSNSVTTPASGFDAQMQEVVSSLGRRFI